MRRSPSAFTVASCLGDSPMIDRVSVILSFLPGTGRLLHAAAIRGALAPRGVQILKALDPTKRVDRRLEHVVRVVRAERLREDVLDAGRLQHGTYGTAGNDAGARHGRLEKDPAGAEVPGDLA